MTVADLIRTLSGMPQDAPVFIAYDAGVYHEIMLEKYVSYEVKSDEEGKPKTGVYLRVVP